jgi:phosphoserine phosphatase RsbU/P
LTLQILIIDDDPTTCLMVSRILQKQNYQVTVAANGAEGLAQAQQLQPALIICDWMMPEMDGIEVCRQVKADASLATTFFILLTARNEVADRVQGLDAGADEFLSKPIDPGELRARVQAGLRLRQLTLDLQAQMQEGARYVRSLLPQPQSQPLQIASCFIPSRQLGGDCFDYFWIDEQSLVVYLLDVSGHGLGSALPSVSILNWLRSQTLPNMNYRNPELILRLLNQAFQMEEQDQKYFTIWYGVYDHSQGTLAYASAGHPPALLITQDAAQSNLAPVELQQLQTPNPPIGMFEDQDFVSQSCPIAAGSNLYIFSDGIYEILQANGSIWGLDAFIDLLRHQNSPMDLALDQIVAQVRKVSPQPNFEDDLALIQIKF